MKKIRKICTVCGSTDIRFDAWAEWDEVNQKYELIQTYDDVYCEGHEGACTVKDEEYDDGESQEERAKAP